MLKECYDRKQRDSGNCRLDGLDDPGPIGTKFTS